MGSPRHDNSPWSISTDLLFAARLARVRGGLDAVEAVKTGVEKHTRMAENATVQVFSAIRAAVDSREKEILKVDLSWCGVAHLSMHSSIP